MTGHTAHVGPRAVALQQQWLDIAATLDPPHREAFLRGGLTETATLARIARARDDLDHAVEACTHCQRGRAA